MPGRYCLVLQGPYSNAQPVDVDNGDSERLQFAPVGADALQCFPCRYTALAIARAALRVYRLRPAASRQQLTILHSQTWLNLTPAVMAARLRIEALP